MKKKAFHFYAMAKTTTLKFCYTYDDFYDAVVLIITRIIITAGVIILWVFI